MTRALVTGANGFIGSNLANVLSGRGLDVRCFILAGTDENALPAGAEVARGDITNPASLEGVMDGVDVVFHLAAAVRDWGPAPLFMRVNVEGTRNVLEEAKRARVKRFVLVSSLAIHRFRNIDNGDEDLAADNTALPYAHSKILAEDLCRKAHEGGGIETTIVRPGLFPFGPNDMTSFYPLAVNIGRMSHVRGGRALLCTAYVENLVDGIALCGLHPAAAGRTYVIADGARITWKDLMDGICDALGARRPRLSIPYPVAISAAAALEGVYRLFRLKGEPLITRYRVNLVSHDFYFGIDRARRELGYEPQVGIEEALRRTVDWFRRASGG